MSRVTNKEKLCPCPLFHRHWAKISYVQPSCLWENLGQSSMWHPTSFACFTYRPSYAHARRWCSPHSPHTGTSPGRPAPRGRSTPLSPSPWKITPESNTASDNKVREAQTVSPESCNGFENLCRKGGWETSLSLTCSDLSFIKYFFGS